MLRWFGHRYLAPIYEDTEKVPVPLGNPCTHCTEEILAGDDGFIIDAVLADGAHDAPFHRACWLRGIFGSVAHIERQCSCFVPGSDECDPPGMSKREAAELAVKKWYERN